MEAFSSQKDLVATFKRETILIVGTINKVHSMSSDLSRDIFKDNALDKPTQHLFNHLSYYLMGIIDSQAARGLPWPLYDTKTERDFRNSLSSIISDYSSKGLLSPVMSSYLVNPGCYKVTLLLFQMSQLALQKTLLYKMCKEEQRKVYNDMTGTYKSDDKQKIAENVDRAREAVTRKLSNYMNKRQKLEQIADIMHKRITEMESKLSSLKAQEYIDNIVDGFLKSHNVDDMTKKEILNIKEVNKPAKIFDDLLSEFDQKISKMENKYDENMKPFLKLAQDTQKSTEMLISKQTGQADKSLYMLEFNPKTDHICTKELLSVVNSEQKYILKNIIKNGQLSFPNLVRGFLVAVSYIQKNAEHGDDIFMFNEYLDGGRRQFSDIASSMKVLLDRIVKAEAKLSPQPVLHSQIQAVTGFFEIPPLPDLSDLKMGKDLQSQSIFEPFTPLSIPKHQFNLHRKSKGVFTKPQLRPLLVAPFYQGPRDDFLKSLISCRTSSYSRSNTMHTSNMSMISQTNYRSNETIAECSNGFTKQQIMRLLSTKKSSSSKKFKYKTERPINTSIKKGGLFNESQASNDSNGLYRSYSSPNLFENREKKSKIPRKLSIMQEDCPLLEVSGISALEKDCSYGTPEGVARLVNSRKLFDASSLPAISVTPVRETINTNDNSSHVAPTFSDVNISKLNETVLDKDTLKTETPTNNPQLIRKTNSLEKIINRFKKVKAKVLISAEKDDDFRTIVEEKENMNMVNVEPCTAYRVLLPDLLSPSYNFLPNDDVEIEEPRKPRESLGTALGVDHTFLDQFDLID